MPDPSIPVGVNTLVGREREQATLRDTLAAALAGHGALVLIGGEAGIGKTALAEALLTEATDQGALALVGRCYDLSETPPYGPWAEALAGAPPTPDLPTPPALGGGADAGGSAASRETIVSRVRDYLSILASRRPLVLLLDDLQWADAASLDLLRAVARGLAASACLVLATYRADELTRQHPLYGLLPLLVREARAVRLDLKPLGEEAVQDLLRARYRLATEDERRLVAYLRGRTEGNPFYLGEVLRSLAEDAVLAARGDTWVLGDLSAAPVPALVRQVLDGRLDRLGGEARELLAVAAAIGHEMSLAQWQALTGRDEATLVALLERAAEAHILMPTANGGRFAHELIREALYAGTPPARLRAWHRRAGELLAAQPRPDPDAVADHFRRAGDARAIAWLLRAADRAQGAYAWASAAGRLEAVLALMEARGGEPGERGWLYARLARLRRREEAPRALAEAEQVLRLAVEADDPRLAAYGLVHRGMLRCRTGSLRAGLADMAAAVAAMEALDPGGPARAAARAPSGEPLPLLPHRERLAYLLSIAGRYVEAATLAEPLVAGAPATRTGDTGGAHLALAESSAYLGRPVSARRLYAEAHAHFAANATSQMVGLAAFSQLLALELPYFTDEPEARARLTLIGEQGWQRAHDLLGVAVDPRLAHLPALALAGQWDEAQALALATRAGGGANALAATGVLCPLVVARGEVAFAWELVREVLPAGPVTDPGDTEFATAITLQRAAAALALDAGDLPTARAWLAAHDRWLAWSGAVTGRPEGQIAWAAYHRAAGAAASAYQHAEQALAYASEPRQPLALLLSHRLLGELDLEAGRHTSAATHLEAALALAEACAVPYERALTLVALADLRGVVGDWGGARAALNDARAILTALGAQPALARSAPLAARLAARPAPAATYPNGLTAREVDVLRLVAAGLADAQVADRLFVSLYTVKAHLRSIYGKLGVENRAAATRFAVERGLA